MSNASQRNFGAAMRERDRRLGRINEGEDLAGLNQSAYLGQGYDAFFGSLRELQDAAAQQGMGFRADLSGLGRDDAQTGGLGSLNPLEAQSLKYQVMNAASNDEAQRRQAQNAAQDAYAKQLQQGNINDLHTAYQQHVLASAVPPAAAPVTERGTDMAGNLAFRMRPNPNESPYQRLASTLPGGAQPALAAQLAQMDERRSADELAARKQAEVERANRAKEAVNAPFVPPTDASGTPLTGAAVLQGLPTTKQNMVKRVLSGEQAIPTGAALKDPYWKGLIEVAGLVDPNFDTVNYNARNKTRQDFTSGKAAGQVNAINTVIGHLSDLAEQGGKLGNTGMDWVNAVYNKLTPGGTQRGVTINNFETLKEGVANELMRVWRQVGAGSEKEIEDWKATIGASKSPEELQGAFKTIGGMLESKLGALDSQYKQGMGTDAVSAIMPESRQRLDALQGRGGAPAAAAGGVVVVDPNGGRHTFKDQASADAFKSAAGIR